MKSTIAIGNYVRIKNQASIGQVVRISQQKKVLVTVGALRLYLPLKAVEVVAPPSAQKGATKQSGFAMTSSSRQIDPTLDLHGLNKAQALLALENVSFGLDCFFELDNQY